MTTDVEKLREDMTAFVRWSANVRNDTAEAIAVARALLARLEAAAPATEPSGERAGLAGNDLAAALYAAYSVLGYWPDPKVIDGRWEMWGVALRAALDTGPAE